jgi:hypothetical protein
MVFFFFFFFFFVVVVVFFVVAIVVGIPVDGRRRWRAGHRTRAPRVACGRA